MEKKILLANKKVIYIFLYVPFIRVEAVRDERFTTSPVGQLTQEHFTLCIKLHQQQYQ